MASRATCQFGADGRLLTGSGEGSALARNAVLEAGDYSAVISMAASAGAHMPGKEIRAAAVQVVKGDQIRSSSRPGAAEFVHVAFRNFALI